MATMFFAGKSALLEFWEAFDEMNIFLKLLACAALVIVSHLVVILFYSLIFTICDRIKEKLESKRPPRPSAMKLLETSQETFVDAQVRVNCQLKPGKVFPIKVRFMRGKNNEWIALHSTLNGRDCLRDCSVKCSRCRGALLTMLSHDIGLLEKEPITLYDLDSSTGYSDYINNKYKAVLEQSDSIACKMAASGVGTASLIRMMDEAVLDQLKKEEEAAHSNENQ